MQMCLRAPTASAPFGLLPSQRFSASSNDGEVGTSLLPPGFARGHKCSSACTSTSTSTSTTFTSTGCEHRDHCSCSSAAGGPKPVTDDSRDHEFATPTAAGVANNHNCAVHAAEWQLPGQSHYARGQPPKQLPPSVRQPAQPRLDASSKQLPLWRQPQHATWRQPQHARQPLPADVANNHNCTVHGATAASPGRCRRGQRGRQRRRYTACLVAGGSGRLCARRAHEHCASGRRAGVDRIRDHTTHNSLSTLAGHNT